MKFFIPFLATAAFAASLGTPVEKRQVSVIQAAVASISAATVNLNDAVTAFQGSNDQVLAVQTAAQAVLTAITTGTDNIRPIAVIPDTDALSLTGPITDLGNLVNTTVNNVISKKDLFVNACVGPLVLTTVTQLRDASSTFADVTISKVSAGLQGIARSLAQPIIDALNRGIAAFADQTSTPPSCNGSSTTEVPVPTTSVTTTPEVPPPTTSDVPVPTTSVTTTPEVPPPTTSDVPIPTTTLITSTTPVPPGCPTSPPGGEPTSPPPSHPTTTPPTPPTCPTPPPCPGNGGYPPYIPKWVASYLDKFFKPRGH